MTDRILCVRVYRDEQPILLTNLPASEAVSFVAKVDADGLLWLDSNILPDPHSLIVGRHDQKLTISLWTEEPG